MAQFALSRAKAFGGKWQRWYTSQRLHEKPKEYPEEHRKHNLLEQESDATYHLNQNLRDWIQAFKNM